MSPARHRQIFRNPYLSESTATNLTKKIWDCQNFRNTYSRDGRNPTQKMVRDITSKSMPICFDQQKYQYQQIQHKIYPWNWRNGCPKWWALENGAILLKTTAISGIYGWNFGGIPPQKLTWLAGKSTMNESMHFLSEKWGDGIQWQLSILFRGVDSIIKSPSPGLR